MVLLQGPVVAFFMDLKQMITKAMVMHHTNMDRGIAGLQILILT